MATALTLFDQPVATPEGFHYYPDFITVAQETELIHAIQNTNLHPMVFQGYTAKRKVASFGHDWNFTTRSLTPGAAIPQDFEWLVAKIAAHLLVTPVEIAELLVTEYPPGSVINWHRDAPPFDQIAGISLATDCLFKLRPYAKQQRNRKSTITVPVQRQSLYTIQGPARTDWEHSIAPVTSTRYSVTVRTLAKISSLGK